MQGLARDHDLLHHRQPVCGQVVRQKGKKILAGDGLRRLAKALGRKGVHGQNEALRVQQHDGLVSGIQQGTHPGLAFPYHMIGAFALADITHEAHRHPTALHVQRRDRQLHRKFAAILAQAREPQRLVDGRPFAGQAKLRKTMPERLAKALWRQQRMQILP